MEKFKNKYRIPSARHPNWDFSSEDAYFITICTQNREHYFGKIENGKMVLSNIGVIADILWYEIPYHATHVELGAFVVMPNHVHGILILTGNDNTDTNTINKPTPITTDKNKKIADISPKSGSVSTIIRSYKSAVTKHAHRLGFEFAWQTRFHDHIIRNEESFQKITHYIINNPINWNEDKFFKSTL